MSQISLNLPGVVVRKLIGLSVSNARDYELAMSGFNVLCRYDNIINCVVLAICSGYLPPAAYTYAAENWKRYLRLSLHLEWISFVWCIVTTIFPVFMPVTICMLFGSGDDYLRWSAPILKASCVTGWILFCRFTFQTMLQAQQRGTRAMIISFTSNFVAIIGLFSYYMLQISIMLQE